MLCLFNRASPRLTKHLKVKWGSFNVFDEDARLADFWFMIYRIGSHGPDFPSATGCSSVYCLSFLLQKGMLQASKEFLEPIWKAAGALGHRPRSLCRYT